MMSARVVTGLAVGALMAMGSATPASASPAPSVPVAATVLSAPPTAPDTPCDRVPADFAELQAALGGSEPSTVCLGGDIVVEGDETLVLDVTHDVVLDLAGHSLVLRHQDYRFATRGTQLAPGVTMQIVDRTGGGLLHSSAYGGRGFGTEAGIGVPPTSTLIVWSGRVEAQSDRGAGIGGGVGRESGTVTVHGGEVDVLSDRGAGIGGGGYSPDANASTDAVGTITITGGTVTAQSGAGSCGLGICTGSGGAAIGAGHDGDFSRIRISGGSVLARGLTVAIGGGHAQTTAPGSIEISGGKVRAFVYFPNTAAIGSRMGGPPSDVTVSGGEVIAAAGAYATAIGSTYSDTGDPVPGGNLEIERDGVVRLYKIVTSSGGPGEGYLTPDTGEGMRVDGTLDLQTGLAVSPAGSPESVSIVGETGRIVSTTAGDDELDLGDSHHLDRNPRVFGRPGAVLVNNGVITAPVDLTNLTVRNNNYVVTWPSGPGMSESTRVFAPSFAAAESTFPAGYGSFVAWYAIVGEEQRIVEAGTDLATAVTSGSRADGTANVRLLPIAGRAVLGLADVAEVGEVVPVSFSRVRLDGAPLDADDGHTLRVTDAGGADVTADTVTDGRLSFARAGEYTVTATSTAAGFTHLTATAQITVVQPPVLAEQTPPAAVSGVPYAFDIPVSGFPAPELRIDGSLPSGLELVGAAITGVPTRAGEYAFTVTARSSAGTAEREYRIDVSVGAPRTLALSIPGGEIRPGEAVPVQVTGTDMYGQEAGDLSGAVDLRSSVSGDVVDGLLVTFSSAGPRDLVATLRDDPTVSARVRVEVVTPPSTPAPPSTPPAPSATGERPGGGLAGTGGAGGTLLPGALMLVIAGIAGIGLSRRRDRGTDRRQRPATTRPR